MTSEVMDWDGAYKQEGASGPAAMEHRRATARARGADRGRQDHAVTCSTPDAATRNCRWRWLPRLHRRRHRCRTDRHRRGHQGRRGARAYQRHVRLRRHHVVHRLRRADSPRSSTARCSTRCRSRAATATCARSTGPPHRVRATTCWCSPRAPSRPSGHQAHEVDEDELRAAVSQVLRDRRDPAGEDPRPQAGVSRHARPPDAVRSRREGPDEDAGLPAQRAQSQLMPTVQPDQLHGNVVRGSLRQPDRVVKADRFGRR